MRANIFAADLTGSPLFSGWNAFAGRIPAGEVSSFSAVPRFSDPQKGVFTLENHNVFSGRSGDGFPVGPYRYIRTAVPGKMQSQLGSVSATTANFMFSGNAVAWAHLQYGLDEKCSDTYEQDFEDAQYDWPEDECYDDADSAGEEDGKQ